MEGTIPVPVPPPKDENLGKESTMNKALGVRQFGLLILSATMIAIGYMGLTDSLTTRSTLLTVCIGTIAILSFSLGHQSAQL
ncbi:hypothetical protein [Halorussus sp. GCM10023401]|uniref:hypothetical protein n=1 Tax=Halorussus sp. GCM10023401 TaxID=3252680 RepID=UPI0036D3700C